MSGRKIDFADRLETAAKAKQALLEKARAKDPANDPEFAARLAERAAVAAAREGEFPGCDGDGRLARLDLHLVLLVAGRIYDAPQRGLDVLRLGGL